MAEIYGMCDECLDIDDITLEKKGNIMVWLCSECKLKLPKNNLPDRSAHIDRQEPR